MSSRWINLLASGELAVSRPADVAFSSVSPEMLALPSKVKRVNKPNERDQERKEIAVERRSEPARPTGPAQPNPPPRACRVSSSESISADRPPQSGGLQHPHTYGYHYDHVQDGLDARGHGNEAIDQVQCHSDNDQCDHNVYQRHGLLLMDRTAIRRPMLGRPRSLFSLARASYSFLRSDRGRPVDRAWSQLSFIAIPRLCPVRVWMVVDTPGPLRPSQPYPEMRTLQLLDVPNSRRGSSGLGPTSAQVPSARNPSGARPLGLHATGSLHPDSIFPFNPVVLYSEAFRSVFVMAKRRIFPTAHRASSTSR